VTLPICNASKLTLKYGDICPTSVIYENDGHGFSLKYSFKDEPSPSVSGGPLWNETYSFVNLHLHWVSEHTISSKHYDGEMHIVFFNTKYGSFANAIKYSDGLAVLGFMLYVKLC
jgi:carbonic anhydrase